MTKEERDWLDAAMKEYTYNDCESLVEISKTLKQDIENGFTEPGKFNNF